jgi:hypothetical protein
MLAQSWQQLFERLAIQQTQQFQMLETQQIQLAAQHSLK